MSAAAEEPRGLVDRVIIFSIENRALVVILAAVLALAGAWALARTPIDAIPDLSENQVIVFADWPGRAAREVEDQVTYPLSVSLHGLPGVKTVRSVSELGFAMVNVIFEDGIDPPAARARVLERLSASGAALPADVKPVLAPDATALGQIFWYTIEAPRLDLGERRAIQDWYLRYPLQAVEGVAEVAPVGGFVRELQVDLDPVRLRAFGVTLGEVYGAVARSSGAVGGSVIEKNGAEYRVRGAGWLRGPEDLEPVVVAARGGVPIRLRDVASVQVGPAPRRAVLERDGEEAVGAVVLMRAGENPLAVTERVKRRLEELAPGLPAGVRIVPFYERTYLVRAAIGTLEHTIGEEMLATIVVVVLVMRHLRSSLVIAAMLPLAALFAFIGMRALGVPANIMSLSGIAISVGVLVDAGIVMTENAHARLHERFGAAPVSGDTRAIVREACLVVGRPLFFSIAVMVVSFLPVFALGGMEGRMIRPLAWTKTLALGGAALLAITLVPALLPSFLRGRLRGESESGIVRGVAEVYRPVLAFLLDRPRTVALLFAITIGLGLRVLPRLGSEFMPPLDEGAIMDMPVSVASTSVPEARRDLIARDPLLRELPEVECVVGKAGRAETATDPAPVNMVETVVDLRPKTQWARRSLARERFEEAARALAPDLSDEKRKPIVDDAQARFDAAMRAIVRARVVEQVATESRLSVQSVLSAVAERGSGPISASRVAALADERSPEYAPLFAGAILASDVRALETEAAHALAGGATASADSLLAERESWGDALLAPWRALSGEDPPRATDRLREALETARDAHLESMIAALDWDLEARAPAIFVSAVNESAAAHEVTARAPTPTATLRLARKTKQELVEELDSILRIPGWANIWTQPMINRVDMLATGIRTQVGVKVLGPDLDTIERVAGEIAAVLRGVTGAADVVPDRASDANMLDISIDRERAGRYGVAFEDVQETIEVALGGKAATTTIDGRRRTAVRVRYAREWREDEARVGDVLVTGRAAGAGMAPQVPLGLVASVRVGRGPAMIQSEDGFLRASVQLNVRGRDIVGFVEEAQRAVNAAVMLPPGVFLRWSGEFEQALHARRTLSLVVPAALMAIFLIVFLTYRDAADAVLLLLAVPGALSGGLLFQWMLGVRFSVAVWVGFIIAFGLAVETGVVMLVYLREAIDRRGGLGKIASLDELRAAVMAGAVHRLRPKLLTEGVTIIGLLPMLLSSGVGAEFMRPMAAPVLGGILIADEVIDIFIPVIFFAWRRRRWERLRKDLEVAP